MKQRIFDVENEKDMQDLWDILPDEIIRIYLEQIECFESPRCMVDFSDKSKDFFTKYIKINWHDKTEITRPIQEATEQDIGKICAFWEDGNTSVVYAELVDVLPNIVESGYYKYQAGHESNRYEHCRRLTKQEIEELC